jgi:5-deoxy-D-glucuronate isomerase
MSDEKGPKNPLEIKKKILADPNTAKIAQTLGVDLAEYVEGVVHFVMNPDQKPELVVVTDEVAKERFGLTLPKEGEIIKQFETELELATVADKTDFQAAKVKPMQMETPEAPSAERNAEDLKLKEELKKQLRGKGSGNA